MKSPACKITSPIFFISILFFQGCATLPEKTPGELVPLSASTSFKRWGGVRESGVSEDCGYVPLPPIPSPKGKKSFFTKTDAKVTWWATFQPAAFGFIRPQPPGFIARWYAPNGTMYWEESFAGDIGSHFAKNSLPIAGTPAETFPGRWRVQIYYEGRLIDEKEFIINQK